MRLRSTMVEDLAIDDKAYNIQTTNMKHMSYIIPKIASTVLRIATRGGTDKI